MLCRPGVVLIFYVSSSVYLSVQLRMVSGFMMGMNTVTVSMRTGPIYFPLSASSPYEREKHPVLRTGFFDVAGTR